MQSRITKITSAVLFTSLLTFGLTVSLQSFLKAWTEPSVAPPAGASIPLEGKWENGTNPPEIHYSDGYVGINTSDPTERLDVDGKIRMRTQTTDADADDILATKAYVDAVASSSGAGGSVPAGAVTAFYQASCPTGWKAADGTNGTPDLRGMFIRGLNDFGTGIRSDGGEDPDGAGRTYDDGLYQDDELESHRHGGYFGSSAAQPDTTGGGSAYGLRVWTNYSGGNETRPKNVALIYCVKEAGSTLTDDALFDDLGSLVVLKDSKNFQVEGKIIMTSQTAGGDSDDTVATKGYVQRRVSGSCAAGSSIRTINEDGTVECETDDTGSGSVDVYRCPRTGYACSFVTLSCNGNLSTSATCDYYTNTGATCADRLRTTSCTYVGKLVN